MNQTARLPARTKEDRFKSVLHQLDRLGFTVVTTPILTPHGAYHAALVIVAKEATAARLKGGG